MVSGLNGMDFAWEDEVMPLASCKLSKIDRRPHGNVRGQALAGGFLSKRRPSTSQRLLFQKAQLSIWCVRKTAHKYLGLSSERLFG